MPLKSHEGMLYLSSHTWLWPTTLLVGQDGERSSGAAAVTPDWLKQGFWPLLPSFHLSHHLPSVVGRCLLTSPSYCGSRDPTQLCTIPFLPLGFIFVVGNPKFFWNSTQRFEWVSFSSNRTNKSASVSETNPHCLRTMYRLRDRMAALLSIGP